MAGHGDTGGRFLADRDKQFADNKKFERSQGGNTILIFYIRTLLRN